MASRREHHEMVQRIENEQRRTYSMFDRFAQQEITQRVENGARFSSC